MRWVNKAQDWPAHAELYAVAIIKKRRGSDALVVDERAVKASQIMKDKLAIVTAYLCVTTRDDSRRSFNRNIHLRVTPETSHIFAYLYATKLACGGADDLNGRRLRRRRCARARRLGRRRSL